MSEIPWESIRQNAGILGNGNGQCETWCRYALRQPSVRGRYEIRIAKLQELNYLLTVVHFFLWNPSEIADGTAGQYDKQYSTGYYGKFENASARMKAIYSLATDPLMG